MRNENIFKKEIVDIMRKVKSLTNLEIERYYQNECRLNGVYSRNSFPKDGICIKKLDEYKSVGTHC